MTSFTFHQLFDSAICCTCTFFGFNWQPYFVDERTMLYLVHTTFA